jgi:hypothetical protein
LRESVRNITNNTICDIYPIFNLSSSQNNCAETIINNHKIRYHGFYSDSPERININVYLEMYLKPDSNLSHYDYYGPLDYINQSNQSRTWDNDVSINYSNRIRNNNYFASYQFSSYLIDGDNCTNRNNTLFSYDDNEINIIFKFEEEHNLLYNYNSSIEKIVFPYYDELLNWEKFINYLNNSQFKGIIFQRIDIYSLNLSIQEGTSNEIFFWSEKDNGNGMLITNYLIKNGSFLDPKLDRFEKTKFKKFGVTIGGRIQYYFILYNKDVDFITYLMTTVGLAVDVLGVIISGGIITVIAAGIQACWGTLLYLHEDPTDGDMEFRIKIIGNFATGGYFILYGYQYDRGDKQQVVMTGYIDPITFGSVWYSK